MIAAATGFTIVRMKGGETGPAYGAARLARMAATGEPAEAVCVKPEIADVSEPNPRRRSCSHDSASTSRRFTAAVKPEFRR